MKQTSSIGHTTVQARNVTTTTSVNRDAAGQRENGSTSKRAKYKHLKIRTVAADYLSSISLNGSNDVQHNKAYFEKVISNDFDCFLTLNKINLKPEQQTEFFKYYKQKLVMEKREKSRLNEFLASEFSDQDGSSKPSSDPAAILLSSSSSTKSYVESIMSDKAKQQQQTIVRANTTIDHADQNAKRKLEFTPSGGSSSINAFASSTNLGPANALNHNKLSPRSASPSSLANLAHHAASILKTSEPSDVDLCSSSSGKKQVNNDHHHQGASSSVVTLQNSRPLNTALLAASAVSASSSSQQKANNKQATSSRLSKSPTDSQANLAQGDGIPHSKAGSSLSSSSSSAVVTLAAAQKINHPANALTGSASATNPAPVLTSRQYKRTISESSTDSNYMTVNSVNSLGNRYGQSLATTWNSNKLTMAKPPSLYNSLKRLTNEKLMMTSNNSPLGIFSRLPFSMINRSSANKSELNESFARTRHMSVNKTNQPPCQNYFIYDVFELLDLDIEEYAKSGLMSYCNLIDPVPQNKRSLFRRSNTVVEDSQPGNKIALYNRDSADHDKIDEGHEDSSDKDEQYQQFKKENSPFGHLAYHSEYLDDPQLTELTAGKNRTCLKFASYAVSIIDYVKPLELKKEINETFREKFPYIQISLTKLRSIKREMVEIAFEASLDMIIVVQSYIFFEKLILQGLINKVNRKFLAANCLILAAKLNDVTKKEINKLIDTIIAKFRFDNRKEVISYEFAILVALEFNLMVKYETDFVSHYERLINSSHYKKLSEQQLTSVNNSTSHNRTYND